MDEITRLHAIVSAEVDAATTNLRSLRAAFGAAAQDAAGLDDATERTARQSQLLGRELSTLRAQYAAAGGSQDAFTAGLADVRDRALSLASGLDQTSDEYRELMQTAASASRELRQSGDASREARSDLDGLKGAVAGLAAGWGAQEAARMAVELTTLGIQANQAERALEGVSGSAALAEANLAAMRRATGGTLAEVDAMTQATKLLSLGIVTNAREMEDFAHNAAILGAAVGMDATQSIENLAATIANLSFERLDAAGISSGRVRERMAELLATTQGLSREQAFAAATMEEMTRAAQRLEDAGVQAGNSVDRLGAAMRDIQTGFGQALADELNQLDEAARNLSGEGLDFRGAFESATEAMLQMSGLMAAVDYTSAAMHGLGEAIDWVQGRTQPLADGLTASSQASYAAALGIDAFSAASYAGAAAADTVSASIETGRHNSELWTAYLQTQTTELYGSSQASYAAALGIDAFSDASWAGASAADGMTNTLFGLTGGLQAIWADALNAAGAVNQLVAALSQVDPSAAAGIVARQREALAGSRFPTTDLSIAGIDIRIPSAAGIIERATEDLRLQAQQERLIEQQLNRAERQLRQFTGPQGGFGRTGGSGRAGSGAARGLSEAEKAARAAQRTSERAAEQAARAWERSHEQAAREVESAFNSAFGNIRSAVDRNLTLSANVGENDELLDRFGLRIEGTDEIIRRLQDVVNRGDESQWAQYYAELLGVGPGTGDLVKAKAAAMIRDIQVGLVPEAIDRDALLRTTIRDIEGQRAMDALKDSVARELFAMGYGAEEVMRQLGPSFAEEVGALQSELGGTLAVQMRDSILAEDDSFREAGETLGQILTSGTVEGVDGFGPQVVEALKRALAVETEGAPGRPVDAATAHKSFATEFARHAGGTLFVDSLEPAIARDGERMGSRIATSVLSQMRLEIAAREGEAAAVGRALGQYIVSGASSQGGALVEGLISAVLSYLNQAAGA